LLRCLLHLEEPTAVGEQPSSGRRAVLFEGSVRDNLMAHAPGTTLDVSESRLRGALTEVGLDIGLIERDGTMLSGESVSA